MTGPITAARQQLADLIQAAGVNALPFVPEEFPGGVVAIIDGADQYLTRGETYYGGSAEVWLSLTVHVLGDLINNQQTTEDVDDALGLILAALAPSAWQYDPPGRPGAYHTANWLAHGAAIPVANLITLNTQETP